MTVLSENVAHVPLALTDDQIKKLGQLLTHDELQEIMVTPAIEVSDKLVKWSTTKPTAKLYARQWGIFLGSIFTFTILAKWRGDVITGYHMWGVLVSFLLLGSMKGRRYLREIITINHYRLAQQLYFNYCMIQMYNEGMDVLQQTMQECNQLNEERLALSKQVARCEEQLGAFKLGITNTVVGKQDNG